MLGVESILPLPGLALRNQRLVVRSSAGTGGFSMPDEQKLREAEAKAKEMLGQAQLQASALMGQAQGKLNEAVNVAKEIKLETKNLVQWNFIVQLFLTAVSWAVVFTTTHAGLAKGAKAFTLPVALLMVGVLTSGLSTYQSFLYFTKVKEQGEGSMDGFKQMKAYFDHLQINFIGAGATIVALQAEVGTMFASAMTGTASNAGDAAVAAMAQAATNTLLAHLVSIVFLVLLLKKITKVYEDLVAWSDKLRSSMPGFAPR